MPNIRTLNKEKYNISKHRFLELYHYCLQYPEWKEELRNTTDTVRSVKLTGTPGATIKKSATEELAVRRQQLQKKCELIEQTAMEADEELFEYIILGVTKEGVSFTYLYTMKNIPCGRDKYYNSRRKFFWLLSGKNI